MSEDSAAKTIGGPKETLFPKPHAHNEVVANDKIAIMRTVAPNFGFTIVTLAEEGEEYTHHDIDPETRRPTSHTGLVPEGQSYINISDHNVWRKNPDLGELSKFYAIVEARLKAKQPPTNPPKT